MRVMEIAVQMFRLQYIAVTVGSNPGRCVNLAGIITIVTVRTGFGVNLAGFTRLGYIGIGSVNKRVFLKNSRFNVDWTQSYV